MKKSIHSIIATLLCIVTFAAYAESRVTCPQGLKWSSEGYCQVEYDKLKEPKCPAGSHLDQPSVTGPKICRAQGSCPDAGKPNSKGLCGKK